MAAPVQPTGNDAPPAYFNHENNIYQRVRSWMPGPAQREAIGKVVMASSMATVAALGSKFFASLFQNVCDDTSPLLQTQAAIHVGLCVGYGIATSWAGVCALGATIVSIEEAGYFLAIRNVPAAEREEVFQRAQLYFTDDMNGPRRASLIRRAATQVHNERESDRLPPPYAHSRAETPPPGYEELPPRYRADAQVHPA